MTRPARVLHGAPTGPLLLLSICAILSAGCQPAGTHLASGNAQDRPPPPGRSLTINPSTTSLPEGGSTQFRGTVGGAAATGVQWSTDGGVITSEGVYTAPSAPGSYKVHAAYDGLSADANVNVMVAGAPASFFANASATCAGMPIRSTGTTYYFCDCQTGAESGCAGHAGADANYATYKCSIDHPCQTWTQVITTFNAMNAGDTIALCKGGAWAVPAPSGALDCGYNLTNPRCAAGSSLTDAANTSTCDIRDYTPSWGGAAKPLVAVSSTTGGRIINRFNGSVNGVRILNLAFQGSNAGPRGGVYHNDTAIQTGLCNVAHDSDWLVCNNTFDRFRLAMQMANSSSTWSNFLVWGNRFTMNDLDAMLTGTGDNNRIDANYFDNNGGITPHPTSGNSAHSLYLVGMGSYGTSHNLSVVNNEFRRSAAASSSAVGPCSTVMFEAHHQYDGVTIENNLIDAGPSATSNCWGMDLRAAGSPPTYFRNMTVRRNQLNSGGAGIVVGQAPGVVIEDNIITLLDGGTWKMGIMSPQDQARTASNGGPDDVENNATIRNNTIFATGTAASLTGVLVGTEGTGHVIANNAVQLGGNGTCFSTTLEAGAYAFVGNNACYGGSWGTSYDSTTHITTSLLFTAAPTDFTPATGSPLDKAGNAAYASSTDFNLKVRGNPPAIGACEP